MADTEEIEALRRQIAALEEELAATHETLARKDAQLERILNTAGWRLLSYYGRFKYGVLLPALGKPLRYRYRRFKHDLLLPAVGAVTGRQFASAAAGTELVEPTYADWARACERARYEPERAARRVALLAERPTISVVMPVYDAPADALEAAVRSVRAQLYPDWQLCARDDASPAPHVRRILERHAAEDARVRVSFGTRNGGISNALNQALELATGEYVAFLDHDDALTPDALLEMAERIADTGADLLYSDEDKLDPAGERFDPFFKPGWSPDYLLSLMYPCHLTVCRRELVRAAGGLREGFEGSQDYDLWLRMTELTDRIAHVPKVLYHWRQVPGSTAVTTSNKSYAHERSRRAIGEALERRGVAARVEDGPVSTTFRVLRETRGEPLVSVVVPTRDRLDLLARAVAGLERKTDYANLEIIIVDNGSSDRATLDYLAASPHTVLRDDGAFNFSRLNNEAARAASGEFLLLLNNDTEPLHRGWLRAMVAHGQRPEVGIVGAKLLFPSGKVQHAGVIVGVGGVAGHGHKYFPGDAPGYYHSADLARNFSAVTGACLLVRRDVYLELGGLDAENLAVAFNDVDFCLRARERGYLVVWTPDALLTHFESESRGSALDAREIDYMIARWGETLVRDPYYSPNLTLVHEDFSFDFSKPDGYVVGHTRRAGAFASVELSGERVVGASFRSTYDRLAGLAFDLDRASQAPRDGRIRLSLRGSGAAADVAVECDVPLSTASDRGELFALFDEFVPRSRAAFSFTLSAPDAVRGYAPLLRASAPDTPAFRALHA